MTDFPIMKTWPLPEEALRAPRKIPAEAAIPHATSGEPRDLSEELTPAISAEIARRARQRRYTP